jgi:hypothetical protein
MIETRGKNIMFPHNFPTCRLLNISLIAKSVFFIMLAALITSGCILLPQSAAGIMTPSLDRTATTIIPTTTIIPATTIIPYETREYAFMQTQLAIFMITTPNAPPTGLPPTDTLEPFVPGINETSYAAYVNPQSAVITSQWRDMVNGQRTYVYAGARQDTSGATPDTRQGLIVVDVYSTDFSNHLITFYNAPGSTGVLRITSANGYRLTLASQNGETLYFDVLTRQFVNSLSVTVTAPTITLLPPISPTAAPPTVTWSTEYPAPGTYPPQIYPPPSTPTPIP